MDRPTVDVAIVPDPGESDPLLVTDHERLSRVGRYVVLDVLGIGGMGTVHTAYDPKLDRKVALKILHDKNQRSLTGRARMLREAQALAKLNHPNIVTVHDVDVFKGRLYIAMEYVEGVALDDWLDEADHDWREIVPSFVEAGHGLAAAHRAGITHRDFKPGNVVIGTDGRIRVLDFGLAKTSETQDDPPSDHESDAFASADSGVEDLAGVADKKLTQVGRSVGTPAFMSPEQLFGLPVGPATDQFAFAVALFEALYGFLPFADEDDPDFLVKVSDGVVREVDHTTVPGWIHRALLVALKPSPGDRYPTIDDLLVALADDPARRQRRVVLSVGLIALSSLAVFGIVQGVRTDAAPCSGATERVEAVWGSARQDAVSDAFEATGAPFAAHAWGQVQAALDDYTAQWSEHHEAICEATNVRREQSPALMDVRMACLDRAHAQLSALVGELEQADDQLVSRAVGAVQSLPTLAPCRTEQAGGTAALSPALAEQARQLEADIAAVLGVLVAGRIARALPETEILLDRARALGVPGPLAEALYLRGEALADLNRHAEAVPLYEEAILAARRAGRMEKEVSAWAELVYAEGRGLERVEPALAYMLPAETALAVLDDVPPQLRAHLESSRGAVLLHAGRYGPAERALHRSVQLFREVADGPNVRVANATINRAIALDRLGQRASAIEELEEATEIIEALYGDRHPRAATVALNLGNMLNLSRQRPEATVQYERSLAINRGAFGPNHLNNAKALIGLASVAKGTGDLEMARTRATEALAVLHAQPQVPKTHVAIAENLLGRIEQAEAESDELEAGRVRLRAARAHHQRALDAYLAVFGANPHIRSVRTRAELCRVLRGLGELELARSQCEQALAMRASVDVDVESVDAKLLTDLAALTDDPAARALMLWASYQWRDATDTLADDDAVTLMLANDWWEGGLRQRAVEAVQRLEREATTDPARRRARRWLDAHRLAAP